MIPRRAPQFASIFSEKNSGLSVRYRYDRSRPQSCHETGLIAEQLRVGPRVKFETRAMGKGEQDDHDISTQEMEATKVVATDSARRSHNPSGFTPASGSAPGHCHRDPVRRSSYRCLLIAPWPIWSGNPVFYTQLRLGQHGRVFRIWKLSTMHPNADKCWKTCWQPTPTAHANGRHAEN